MKRRQFSLALAIGSLLSCANMTPEVSANTWITDDGTMELTPEFTVQHVHGQPHSDVYAAFNFIPQKKAVRLRPGDSITVNGQPLNELTHPRGHYYQGRIPVTEGAFTFTLNRAGAPPLTHVFELPALGIIEPPKIYRPSQALRVPVNYSAPAEYVISDVYTLLIDVPAEREYSLSSKARKKDNPYQFDRLPDIQDGAIVFRLIGRATPPPGIYSASIYRQHHVVLSKMPEGNRTGWATLTNTLLFKIEIRN